MIDMMDKEAFIRTIIDHPDDDGPRLVYADFLEELGESEESELIRNNVAGKNSPKDNWSDNTKFSDLLGKTIARINGKVGDDEIRITLITGERYKMYYEQD